MESHPKKNMKKVGETPLRRSSRIHSQAKPTPSIIAAKKSAQMRLGHKKQPVFSFAQDIYQVARDSKDSVRTYTGIVYAEKSTEHRCLWDNNYPECPERVNCIMSRCGELGLLSRCLMLQPWSVTEEQLLTLHTCDHISLLRSTSNCSDVNNLETMSSQFDSIYFHPSTYECSLLAAGSTIKLVDEICKKNIQNGMAIVRPPGHHAMQNEYCGYCYFNNVALAAKHALNAGMKKILIVDWDVHHGQATQQMFYDDNRVLYFSIHRYEYGTFWPNLRESDFDYIGEGAGRGYNFNVPLNSVGMRDNDYMAIWHQLLLPVAYEFQPEIVLVSAGFDAAMGDEKGEMELTPAVYAHLLTSLTALANGKVAVVLEGGYYLKSLAEAAAMTLRALLGDPCPGVGSLGPPSKSMQDSILNVIYVHRSHWKSLRHQNLYSPHEPPEEDDEERYVPSLIYHHTETIKPAKYPTRNAYPVLSTSFLHYVSINLNNIIASTKLLKPEHKVCLVYDAKMMDHKNYEDKNHLEQPARISSIYKMLEDFGILKRLHILKSRHCTIEELQYAHNKSHIMEMSSLNKMNMKQLIEKKDIYHSVYFHQDTFKAACLAAGCLLEVVDSVMKGESASGVAVVRPPGHHADIDDPCGFCIFNSVSIAARHAIKEYGLQRVLIVDWDIHHGNGTQEIFFEDFNVLYISVHRFDRGEFFPHTGDGAATLVGRGPGEGFTVNIPWNKGNMGNAEYVAAFCQVILPIAYQYDPELVLVSAGFDAAIADPLGGCKVSPEAFGHMTAWLSPLANGRLVLSLEGGYNINSISYSMAMCAKALLGDPLPRLAEGLAPCPSAVESISETVKAHRNYWTTLHSRNKPLPAENVLTEEKKRNITTSVSATSSATHPVQSSNFGQKNELNVMCNLKLLKELTLTEVNNGAPVDSDENKGTNKKKETPPTAQPSTSSITGTEDGSQERSTLSQFLSDNLQALVNEEMFAIVPLKTCPHLPLVQPVPEAGIDVKASCSVCNDPKENWICLICYTVQCGRYINEHMLLHNADSGHPLTLSFSDLSVWCYSCQAYIDNQVLYRAKNAAHLSKFGTELVWSYDVQVDLH
ncbi:histone deacetylase 6 isoform X3 [Rhodnius prolixus]|uniref:histone deacetylase 6 isoform X3 n=1 Tax=Rhodnius prolixus TaxID=13249 RepID=UPI003D18D9FF